MNRIKKLNKIAKITGSLSLMGGVGAHFASMHHDAGDSFFTSAPAGGLFYLVAAMSNLFDGITTADRNERTPAVLRGFAFGLCGMGLMGSNDKNVTGTVAVAAAIAFIVGTSTALSVAVGEKIEKGAKKAAAGLKNGVEMVRAALYDRNNLNSR